MARRVSRKGTRFVAGWEGFRSCPYRDSAGVWTIGYGETRDIGPRTRCVSERKARRKLRRRLNRDYLPPVLHLPVKLRRREIDGLTSAVYNLGPGLVTDTANSTLARRLRSPEARTYRGRRRIYRQELPKWVNAGGQRLEGLVKQPRATTPVAPRREMTMNVLDWLRNRKKPILGLLAGAAVYIAAKLGLDVDAELAAAIAAGVFGVVVERAYPVFGDKAATPQVARRR